MPKQFTTPRQVCSSCLLPKPSLKNGVHCGVCKKLLCKDCSEFLDESFFSFLQNIPEELTHKAYCWPCYDQKVVPAKAPYLEMMRRAKEVFIFFKKDKLPIVVKRSQVKVIVKDCLDRKETILRLAFLAAQQSCGALIEVELVTQKIDQAGYQHSNYSASGFPADIRVSEREKVNPNYK